MTKAQFDKAKPIIQQIEHLNGLKKSINMFPSECYSVEFRLTSGNSVIANNDKLGPLSMNRLINEFKSIIDIRIRSLDKELEEI